MHHGLELRVDSERIIQPDKEEASVNIEAVSITVGHCVNQDCRKHFYFVRYRYPGGWGPVSRLQNARNVNDLKQRLKQARESDWVWGCCPETGRKVKRMVEL